MYSRILARLRRHPAQPSGSAGRPVLLVFTFPGGRHSYGEQIAIVEQLPEGLLNVEIVNAWDQLEFAAMYGVLYVPMTILLDAEQRVVAVNADVIDSETLCAQVKLASAESIQNQVHL